MFTSIVVGVLVTLSVVVGMGALRTYLAVAVILVIIKIVQTVLGH